MQENKENVKEKEFKSVKEIKMYHMKQVAFKDRRYFFHELHLSSQDAAVAKKYFKYN